MSLPKPSAATPVRARVLFAPGVRVPPTALAALGEGCARLDLSRPLVFAAPGAAIVLTAQQLTELLAAPPLGSVRYVIWRSGAEALPPVLREHPQLAGIVDAQMSDEAVVASLRAASELAGYADGGASAQQLQQVLEVGRALASERDLVRLLSLILTHARSLTAADGASIYTMEPDGLCFRLWQNASTTVDMARQNARVGEDSIAGYVARTGVPLVLDDVYAIAGDAPYRFNPSFDRQNHYRTRSLLTLPLKNKSGETVGVLQLVNRKLAAGAVLNAAEDFERVLPFSETDREIAGALAAQAGIALENSLLYRDIERLFEGFITASVQAIEARDPVTAGHSFRVAQFCEQLAIAADRSDAPTLKAARFDAKALRELRYAALLHDFGKVGVREDILLKAKKLHPAQLALIRERFRYAAAARRAHAYTQALEAAAVEGPEAARKLRVHLAAEAGRDRDTLARLWSQLLRANEPTVLPADIGLALEELKHFNFLNEEGQQEPLLQAFEFADLSLAKGSLTLDERQQIESHVKHTYAFLRLIPWTADLARLPEIAYAHHEKLDGSGYPRALRREQIPLGARIMSIADIYDALTAGDRPYKSALPRERALDILGEEARAGKIDAELLQVFIEARAYRLDIA